MGKPACKATTQNEFLEFNKKGYVKLEGPQFLRLSNDSKKKYKNQNSLFILKFLFVGYDLLKKMLIIDPKKRITSY